MEYQGAIKEMEKGITRLRKELDEAKLGTKNITERVSYLQ